jgi:hypothetical protein
MEERLVKVLEIADHPLHCQVLSDELQLYDFKQDLMIDVIQSDCCIGRLSRA